VSPRAIRWIVIAVFVIGIAGMIVGSIADDNGVAVTFGLLTAAAAVGLILVTASAPPGAFAKGGPSGRTKPAGSTDRSTDGSTDGGQTDPVDAEQAGQAIEEQVARLVAAGAEEHEVRELVRRAVLFGRLHR
jgi:hypothetical protein